MDSLGDNMEATYLETVVMHNLNKIDGERTIYSIFHLFQGKRSSQTIQDAHLYQLTPFFQAFTPITRTWLEKTVIGLIDKGLTEEISEGKVILTKNGLSVLGRQMEVTPFPRYLNGWKYHQATNPFWEKLTLLVQVCSNLVYRKKGYVPVRNRREVLAWIKHYLRMHGEDRYSLSQRLYEELISALDNPFSKPEYVVMRLTGAKEIGLTPLQAAETAGVEFSRYHFEFLNSLHGMFDKITDDTGRYPLLYGLMDQSANESPLTLSTEKTYRYLEKGYSAEEIAAARNLKESTIEDHIVEIALSIGEFNIDRYLHPEKQQRILYAAKKTAAKKLKEIKERVGDASYFEIRLVLAKYGDAKWN